ncbi:hypothetical protein ASPZODRAFT_2130593 [Penicilliopsis zonata CBS 506.65]|uniref:AB hydrolase-1 domain-containing protein n=1 Tax=Penicilliopsis zonata CBS 506.65 TaxID=1073090 RepID=A0A1L9SFU3_9EURO|nr:hypothetical protein ASPZODRAFT_2130593 [Penicilliopsis zonata CBS 506.65]OJJ45988.1 hypothetical protein ASPZODRAFT_2130593 [Penicilliopsis zonata CBS 506.65]
MSTLVFIPGAWHKPTCYDKVIALLQEQEDLRCVAITLPSTTDNPNATFKDDLDVAQDAIRKETSQGRNVIVVAHSYGGMVGNSAIKGFTMTDETKGGIKHENGDNTTSDGQVAGHVIGLILIASGFTFTGLAFMDPFFGHPPPSWRVNSETGYAELVTPPRELFYHDLPEEEGDFWASQLSTQSLKALFEDGEHTYAGWQDVPVWYIGTCLDRGLPVLAQRIQMGMGRQMGARAEHRELQTSHSPFLSQPRETADIILEAVEAFTGKEPRKSRQDDKIVRPAALLWQPWTWLKFGLPLGLGHVIGGVISFLRWWKIIKI